MMSERTSPVCVDIYCQPDSLPQQHSLGFFITSTDADDDQDSGCCMEDGKHSPQDVSDGSCDTGTGSSCSDDERTDAAECDGAASQREVACYTHVVSHVQHSSPLKNCLKVDDEVLIINDMAIVRWHHDAVVNQFLCQGVGKISLIVRRSGRRKQFDEVNITVELSQGDVVVNATRQKCDADLTEKVNKLLDVNRKRAHCVDFTRQSCIDGLVARDVHVFSRIRRRRHLMTGNEHHVIVLQHQPTVQTLQNNTQPSTVHEFQGIEQDNMKPKQYYGNKVKVFAFESPDSGFYVLCARDGHHVALQRYSDISDITNNLPTSTDSRFFYQPPIQNDFFIFESTQYPDHYLACDGQNLFLQNTSDHNGVKEGKFPELTFKFAVP